jgi:cytidylate kinase
MKTPLVIAIDGTAASGKGTIAARLSDHLDLYHLETGLLYRAVGQKLLEMGRAPSDIGACQHAARMVRATDLDDPALRSEEVASIAAVAAQQPSVRAHLYVVQRDLCVRPPHRHRGIILDGRDTGAVVWPQAQLWLFVTASLNVRIERRIRQLRLADTDASRLAEQLAARDQLDAATMGIPHPYGRRPIVLDTTSRTINQACQAALECLDETLGRRLPQ